MILKFEDVIPCLACETAKHEEASMTSRKTSISSEEKSNEYRTFLNKLKSSSVIEKESDGEMKLSKDFGLNVSDVSKSLAKSVSCISCRTAAERLMKQIAPSTSLHSLALDPIRIDRSGFISLKPSLLKPEALYTLLYTDR